MREIKFRAWDTTFNDMNIVEAIDYVEKTISFLDKDGEHQKRDFVHMKLLQYTGLNDKNGVEIYESDLVKVSSDMKGDWTGEVIFNKGQFLIKGSQLSLAGDISHYGVEVVSNKYES